MAAPALGLLILLAIAERAGPLRGLRVAVAVGTAGTAAGGYARRINAPDRTAEYELWMEMLRTRTVYAFLPEWPLADWIQNLLGLATLALAATTVTACVPRRLAWLCAADWRSRTRIGGAARLDRQFDLLLLAQSWRWPWLSRFVAVALLPVTLATLWKEGAAGRACALLVASAWLLSDLLRRIAGRLSLAVWSARGI